MKQLQYLSVFIFLTILLQNDSFAARTSKGREIWSVKQANEWYARQGWLVGCNYIPGNAINQLEMWQESTFSEKTIAKELGWAASLGMNTVRVYLHDLLYEQDKEGFLKRIAIFLKVAAKHKIKPMFVLFDSCWDPFPALGTQRAPKPHVHNSGWVQSPGYAALKDPAQQPRLEAYVKGVVSRFANDKRVLAWDVWNEPDNMNNPSYLKVELPDKSKYVYPLMKKAFAWARSVSPIQPLTSGVWSGDWTQHEKLKPIDKLAIEESDVISFHNYSNAASFENHVKILQRYNRPVICSEYMARPSESLFATILPIAQKYNIAVYNWGLVDGKTQTKYPWDSWEKQYSAEPPLWFHDIFRADGKPYKPEEVKLIKELTTGKK